MNLEQIYSQVILEKINSSFRPAQQKLQKLKDYLKTKNKCN
jgi:hypothetical protein